MTRRDWLFIGVLLLGFAAGWVIGLHSRCGVCPDDPIFEAPAR